MSISMINGVFNPIPGITTPSIQPKPGTVSGAKNFAAEFQSAVQQVDKMQGDADKQIESLVTKKTTIAPHEAMIALEKADIAFQLMTTIKAKIIRAYEEVMRTQV